MRVQFFSLFCTFENLMLNQGCKAEGTDYLIIAPITSPVNIRSLPFLQNVNSSGLVFMMSIYTLTFVKEIRLLGPCPTISRLSARLIRILSWSSSNSVSSGSHSSWELKGGNPTGQNILTYPRHHKKIHLILMKHHGPVNCVRDQFRFPKQQLSLQHTLRIYTG